MSNDGIIMKWKKTGSQKLISCLIIEK